MVRIGVATTVLPKAGARTAARRPILMFRRMAARATEIGARLALFHPLQVDWAQGTVQAWEPVSANQPSGPWVARKTALPDVIYDNVFVHLAIRGYTAKLRRYARQQGIPLFNPPMYSKWVMQRWLKTTEAGKYVPPAVLPRSGAQTLHTIDRWRDAYLKPVGGYGGMGVTRIQATADGKYRISVDRQRHGRRTRLVLTRQEVANYLQHRLKQQRHFLQQGLKLLTVGGRKVDFRIVTHRGGRGAWHVVGVIPKLAPTGGVVTNIIAGGERMSFGQLQSLAQREGKFIPRHDLEKCALDISRQLSQRLPTVGLIGFDLGVDEEGHVWFIELNHQCYRLLTQVNIQSEWLVHALALFLVEDNLFDDGF